MLYILKRRVKLQRYSVVKSIYGHAFGCMKIIHMFGVYSKKTGTLFNAQLWGIETAGKTQTENALLIVTDIAKEAEFIGDIIAGTKLQVR